MSRYALRQRADAPVQVREAIRAGEAAEQGVRRGGHGERERCVSGARVPDQNGIQFYHSAHDRITRRNPSASANERKITAAVSVATHYGARWTWRRAARAEAGHVVLTGSADGLFSRGLDRDVRLALATRT